MIPKVKVSAGIVGMASALLPLLAGCPSPADDGLEPNNTFATATPLELGISVAARAVQGNPDIFSVIAGPDQTLIFTFVSGGEDDCAAFTVTGPGEVTLYADTHRYCERSFSEPVAIPGAVLTKTAGSYELRVPAAAAGAYYLTVDQKGRADNVIDFRWLYQVTATVQPAP